MARNLTPSSLESDIILGIDLLTNNLNRDVVGVFDQTTLQQIFIDARPMRANIRPTSKVMDHPVETGVTLSDHHIILPKNIELSITIKSEFYSSTLQQIIGAFTNATLLSVQTKAGVYPNMIILEPPHEEDPDMYDMITMGLRLREVQFIAPTSIQGTSTVVTAPANYAPADPENASTVNRGLQSANTITSQQKQSIQDVLNTPPPQ